MRRLFSIALGLLVVSMLGAVLSSAAPVQAAPDTSLVMQGREESPCLAEPAKSAYPQTLLLGERTTITLRVLAMCAGEVYPLHIVLVLDGSGSMEGDKLRQMKSAATEMVRNLDMANYVNTRVGVVEFSAAAKTNAPLTNDTQRVISGINRIQATDGTAIDAGITQGMKELLKARRDAPKGSQINEVMVSV